MEEFKFKVLMFAGLYVNENLLNRGIYGTLLPTLHEKDATIDVLAEKWQSFKDMTGQTFTFGDTIENLKQCTLVDVTLQF